MASPLKKTAAGLARAQKVFITGAQGFADKE